jgi:hypothetical protein
MWQLTCGFFGWEGLNSGLCDMQSRHSTTWAVLPVHFGDGYFGEEGLENYLPGLALNHDPPDLSFPGS